MRHTIEPIYSRRRKSNKSKAYLQSSAYKSRVDQIVNPDYVLLGLIVIIVFIGLIMLSSATSILSFSATSGSYFYLRQQLTHGIIPGSVLFIFTYNFDFNKYKKIGFILLFTTIALLLLVFIPQISITHGGVKSWIRVLSVTVQTSELAKLTFILWLAGWLSSRQQVMHDLKRTTFPFIIILACIAGLLMMQPDLGTLLIFATVAMIMFLIAGGGFVHMAVITILGFLAATPYIISADYRVQRFLTFLDPSSDIQGSGYQIRQALIALGSGSLWGVGIGKSQQKFQFLPELESDSIFAVIGEEWGFIFTSILILLYGLVLVRGITIAKQAPNMFGTLLATGITFVIVIQTLINVGAMVGLLPLTGIPLPFISLGGTNIAILIASIGILANISKQRKNRHG